jgi:hypothetical protein
MPLSVSGTKSAGVACCSIVPAESGGSASSRATLTTPMTSSSEPRHTGYQECAPSLPISRNASPIERPASSHRMSDRGTIIEVSGRSSRWNTFCTIWCSCCSITPASTPSSRLWAISSSVIPRVRPVSICSSFSTPSVETVRNFTSGPAAIASQFIGRASQRETVSG